MNKNKNISEEVNSNMHINQIRPEYLNEMAEEAYNADLLFYKKNSHLFIERKCPACSLKHEGTFFEKDGFKYSKCQGCACIFMNPGPTEELVSDFYRTSSNYKFWAEYMYPKSRVERLRTIHKERATWVLEFLSSNLPHRENLTILELGAGTGDTLISILNYNSLKINGYATEPNPSMEPHLQSNGINVIDALALETEEFFEKFDAVICFEVLEHLLEPSRILKVVYSNLKSEKNGGGYFFASTPNAQSIEVQLLKERSTTIDIEHISVLSPASIQALGIKNSFKIQEITTPGFFDIELLKKGDANCSITQSNKVLSTEEMQNFIKMSGFSSHLKCILKKD
jgi:2-polyprenyl-6-hydroxyphenyl methylase / 3-demethylubiquinone-9 3-methyltransferase